MGYEKDLLIEVLKENKTEYGAILTTEQAIDKLIEGETKDNA